MPWTACELGQIQLLKNFGRLCSAKVDLQKLGHYQSFVDLLICHAAISRDLEVSNHDLDLRQAPIGPSALYGQAPGLVHDHDLGRQSLLLSDCEVAENRDRVHLRRSLDLDFVPTRLCHHDLYNPHEMEWHRNWWDHQILSYELRVLH